MICLNVKSLTGAEFKVDISETKYISCLKSIIEVLDGTLKINQRLVYNGHILKNRFTISNYNITNNSTIDLTIMSNSIDRFDEQISAPEYDVICNSKNNSGILGTDVSSIISQEIEKQVKSLKDVLLQQIKKEILTDLDVKFKEEAKKQQEFEEYLRFQTNIDLSKPNRCIVCDRIISKDDTTNLCKDNNCISSIL